MKKEIKENDMLNIEMPDELEKGHQESVESNKRKDKSVSFDQINRMIKEIDDLKITLVAEKNLKKKIRDIIIKYTSL